MKIREEIILKILKMIAELINLVDQLNSKLNMPYDQVSDLENGRNISQFILHTKSYRKLRGNKTLRLDLELEILCKWSLGRRVHREKKMIFKKDQ